MALKINIFQLLLTLTIYLYLFNFRQLDIKECEDDDKDDLHTSAFPPPTNYIKISQGKIQLVHQPPPPSTLPPLSSQNGICNGLESPKDKVSL